MKYKEEIYWMSILLRIFLGLCLAPLSLLHAQDVIRTDFRMLSLEGGLEDVALVSAEGLIEVKVPSFDRSTVIRYQGEPRLRFVRKSEFVPEGPRPKSLFEVDLSAGVKNPLIIVATSVEGHDFPYQAMVLPDNLEELPGGSSYFINASPYPIAVLFDQGKEPVKMHPRAAFKRSFDEGTHNIRVRIASYADGEVRKGLDSRIYPLPIHRDIYFIYARQGGSAGRLMIRRLREHQSSAEQNFRKADEDE